MNIRKKNDIKGVSGRKKTESEILRIKKLESISVLTSGIAHDFNNLLTAILGNISLAKMYVMEKEVYTHLVEIEKASLRAKDLTQQLLAFSKSSTPIKKIIPIADLIKDSSNFALRGSNVKCDFFISPDLWNADVDEGQINQVINNLVMNAQEAMPDGGTIQVQCDNVTIKERSVLPLKAGHYVKISIKDKGMGIPQENIQKIFDPYFTTKPNGSGFGLSTSYSIVKNHNGYINVESRSRTGTTFYIYLPASPKSFSVKIEENRLFIGHGRILLMDDEEIVRLVTGRMLSLLGYEVEFAKNGEEAVQMYKDTKKSGRPFDAVIMDLTVPGGMGGKEAIKKIIESDTEVKAIVASGYSTDSVMSEYEKYGFRGVVSKPFSIGEISKALHNILEDRNKHIEKAS
jgi:two-component system cell cycle sensor histidine kinase/response regulator CckA